METRLLLFLFLIYMSGVVARDDKSPDLPALHSTDGEEDHKSAETPADSKENESPVTPADNSDNESAVTLIVSKDHKSLAEPADTKDQKSSSWTQGDFKVKTPSFEKGADTKKQKTSPETTTDIKDQKSSPVTPDNSKVKDVPVAPGAGQQPESGKVKDLVSAQCLDCLCQLVTRCNLQRMCEVKEGRRSCGMFSITSPFWMDAGMMTRAQTSAVKLDTDEEKEAAFENCVTDLVCATESIQRYMRKYNRDCNGDGVIDCLDYVAIHTLGPFGCLLRHMPQEHTDSMKSCLQKSLPGTYSEKLYVTAKGRTYPDKNNHVVIF